MGKNFKVLLLVFIAGALFLECGGAKEVAKEKAVIKFLKEVQRGGYGVVDSAQLNKWINQKKKMIIVDTMPRAASYDKNHIPTAVQYEFPIPEMNNMDEKAKTAYAKLLGADKDKLIVVYCGFVKCTRSHNGAMWAVKLGYKNVKRYPGGIKAWKEAGYPVEKPK